MDKKTRDASDICPIEIKIGSSYIKQERSAKLLGIVFNEKQKWSTQIRGPNGVVSGLNKRFFAIKKTEKLHQCQIADQNHRRSIHIQN